MTKDEAIEVLQEACRKVLRRSFDAGIAHIAKDALRGTATIEDDRNAASPAATDEQQGNAIRPSAEPAGEVVSVHASDGYATIGLYDDTVKVGDLIYTATDDQSSIAGAAKGGITNTEKVTPYNASNFQPLAAQPAADPAPVLAQTGTIDSDEFRKLLKSYREAKHALAMQSRAELLITHIDARLNAAVPAQGIDHAKRDIYAELMAGFDALDHAKRAEADEDAQFEAWWEEHGQFCRAGGGDYEKTFAYRAWQARGQQAGGAEVQKTEVV